MRSSKFSGLHTAIVDLVEGFGLLGFETLAIEDKKSMMHLLQVIDRAGGYAFGGAEGANDTVWQVAMREGTTLMDVKDVQERWIDAKDDYDEKERKQWEEEAKVRDAAQAAADAGNGDDDSDDMGLPPQADSGVKVVNKRK